MEDTSDVQEYLRTYFGYSQEVAREGASFEPVASMVRRQLEQQGVHLSHPMDTGFNASPEVLVMDEAMDYQVSHAEPKHDRKSKQGLARNFDHTMASMLFEILNGVSPKYRWESYALVREERYKEPEKNIRFNYQRELSRFDYHNITYNGDNLCKIYIKPKRIVIYPSPQHNQHGFGSWDYAFKVLQRIIYNKFSEVRIEYAK